MENRGKTCGKMVPQLRILEVSHRIGAGFTHPVTLTGREAEWQLVLPAAGINLVPPRSEGASHTRPGMNFSAEEGEMSGRL